jgi:hypothetical protein
MFVHFRRINLTGCESLKGYYPVMLSSDGTATCCRGGGTYHPDRSGICQRISGEQPEDDVSTQSYGGGRRNDAVSTSPYSGGQRDDEVSTQSYGGGQRDDEVSTQSSVVNCGEGMVSFGGKCECPPPLKASFDAATKSTLCSCRSAAGTFYEPLVGSTGAKYCCETRGLVLKASGNACEEGSSASEADDISVQSDPAKQCPDDQVFLYNKCYCKDTAKALSSSGECVERCPANSHYDVALKQCVCHIAGQTLENGVCRCAMPTHVVQNGTCVLPTTQCGEFQRWDDGSQRCACVADYEWTDHRQRSCRPTCGQLQRWDDGSQRCECSAGYEWADESRRSCRPTCGPSQHWNHDSNSCKCTKKRPVCGESEVLVDGRCVCQPGYDLFASAGCQPKCTIQYTSRVSAGEDGCECVPGYEWTDEGAHECRKSPSCGPYGTRSNRRCECRQGCAAWGNSGCLPKCAVEHTHRVAAIGEGENGGDGCEPEPGYVWTDNTRSSCRDELRDCGPHGSHTSTSASLSGSHGYGASAGARSSCSCNPGATEYGKLGCQPTCKVPYTHLVYGGSTSCLPLPGYGWTDASKKNCRRLAPPPPCPEDAIREADGECTCRPGYTWTNAAKTACKALAPCGLNAVRNSSNRCQCLLGFTLVVLDGENVCESPCPGFSHRVGRGVNGCEPDAGYQWSDGRRTACHKKPEEGQAKVTWPLTLLGFGGGGGRGGGHGFSSRH